MLMSMITKFNVTLHRKALKDYYSPLWILPFTFIHHTMFLTHGLRMLYLNNIDADLVEIIPASGICIRYYLLVAMRSTTQRLLLRIKKLHAQFDRQENIVLQSYVKKAYLIRMIFIVNLLLIIISYTTDAYFVRLPSLQVNESERRILPYK